MKVRFSVIAFVPPNAQLGVVGSAPFLGEWDIKKCLPLLLYSSPPAGSSHEPSLWFRDVEVCTDCHASVVDGGAAAAGVARRERAAPGEVAAAAVFKEEDCKGAGCCFVDGNSGGRVASSRCSQCSSSNGTSLGVDHTNNGVCLTRGSSRQVADSSYVNRCVCSGGCSRFPSSTCCTTTTSSSRRTTGSSMHMHDCSRSAIARGLDSNCDCPAAAAAMVSNIREPPPFVAHCALLHSMAPLLDRAPPRADTASAAARPALCHFCRGKRGSREEDFAWQLLQAASYADISSNNGASVIAVGGSSNTQGSSSCCCYHVCMKCTPATAATVDCGAIWKHPSIHSRHQPIRQLERLKTEVNAECEPPRALCYAGTSAAHLRQQDQQSETQQVPLRRCCRRRDQVLSSVEGTGYSGAAAAAGGHSNGTFTDAGAAAAPGGGQPLREGCSCSAAADSPPCAHAYFLCGEHDQDTGNLHAAVIGDAETCECDSLWAAAAYSIDPRNPAVLQLLESHPLTQLQFEYKFILWYPPCGKAALPCLPAAETTESGAAADAYFYDRSSSSSCAASAAERATSAGDKGRLRVLTASEGAEEPTRGIYSGGSARGEGLAGWETCVEGRGGEGTGFGRTRHRGCCCCDGKNRDGWRKWLFPPLPARLPSPPEAKEMLVWEGTGPAQNRKFAFDPFDVVVDVNNSGELQCLYMCKIAHFRDPRAGGTGEYELTTRFYNSVRSESRMHFAKICPRLYVGSCPRQLLHIRRLKEELKVTCIFNLQTEHDICNNYPDPLATGRSAEQINHLYDSQGLRYVWLPTTDMCDSARKTACANAAFLLLGLIMVLARVSLF